MSLQKRASVSIFQQGLVEDFNPSVRHDGKTTNSEATVFGPQAYSARSALRIKRLAAHSGRRLSDIPTEVSGSGSPERYVHLGVKAAHALAKSWTPRYVAGKTRTLAGISETNNQ